MVFAALDLYGSEAELQRVVGDDAASRRLSSSLTLRDVLCRRWLLYIPLLYHRMDTAVKSAARGRWLSWWLVISPTSRLCIFGVESCAVPASFIHAADIFSYPPLHHVIPPSASLGVSTTKMSNPPFTMIPGIETQRKSAPCDACWNVP